MELLKALQPAPAPEATPATAPATKPKVGLSLAPLNISATLEEGKGDGVGGGQLASQLATGQQGTLSRLDEIIARRLLESHAKAAKRRLRISGIAVTSGVILAVGGIGGIFILEGLANAFCVIAITIGFFMLGMSVLPTDKKIIRFANLFACFMLCPIAFYASTAVFDLLGDTNSIIVNAQFCRNHISVNNTWVPSPLSDDENSKIMMYCIFQNIQYWIDFSNYVCGVLAFAWVSRFTCSKGCKFVVFPRVAYMRLFGNSGSVAFVSGCGWLLATVMRFIFSSTDPTARNYYQEGRLPQQIITCMAFFIFAFCCTPPVRNFVRGILAGSSGAAAQEASMAASVSAVIGGGDVKACLEEATKVFRSISFDELSESDFDSNSAAVELNMKAAAAKLGAIDAFLSHSWSDDKAKKWILLEKYAAAFRELHNGRAPLLWLDRACLNQEDIAGSLSHLPVHMAGCKALVIVAGPTYTSRLWTLLELFVWLSMGKEQKKIEIFPIERNSAEEGKSVEETFKSVDVHDAACYNAADRAKILAIIEASFNSLKAFDRHVSKVLQDVWKETMAGGGRRRSSLGRNIMKGMTRSNTKTIKDGSSPDKIRAGEPAGAPAGSVKV